MWNSVAQQPADSRLANSVITRALVLQAAAAADVDQNQMIHIADIIMSLILKSASDHVPLKELSCHHLKTEFLQFNSSGCQCCCHGWRVFLEN